MSPERDEVCDYVAILATQLVMAIRASSDGEAKGIIDRMTADFGEALRRVQAIEAGERSEAA